MKYKFLWIFIFIKSIHLAPVDNEKNLFNVLEKDSRFEKLLNRKFVKSECEINKPLCFALIDVTLKLKDAEQDFVSKEMKDDDHFCESLIEALPDSTKIHDDTSMLLKRNNFSVSWFKDFLKENNGQNCEEECMYTSFGGEEPIKKIKYPCFFVYNQYNFLTSLTVKKESEKIINSVEQQKSKS